MLCVTFSFIYWFFFNYFFILLFNVHKCCIYYTDTTDDRRYYITWMQFIYLFIKLFQTLLLSDTAS